MGWGCGWSRRLSVIEELRGNLCSPARADSRSSSVAPGGGARAHIQQGTNTPVLSVVTLLVGQP